MKLRIRGPSIRLRLTRSEVDALREHGRVEETISLQPCPFAYAIERSGERLSAHFDGKQLVVSVPALVVRDFCDTDRVGFEETSEGVRILVEKDWQCLAPRDEDESDAFPHPRGGS